MPCGRTADRFNRDYFNSVTLSPLRRVERTGALHPRHRLNGANRAIGCAEADFREVPIVMSKLVNRTLLTLMIGVASGPWAAAETAEANRDGFHRRGRKHRRRSPRVREVGDGCRTSCRSSTRCRPCLSTEQAARLRSDGNVRVFDERRSRPSLPRRWRTPRPTFTSGR